MVTEGQLKIALSKHYGYQHFRTGQLDVIRSVLQGEDSFIIKATGGGKSLCYQLPSLFFTGITVVVTPLISLMEDQVAEARKIGRKDVISLHGKQSRDEWRSIVHHLHQFQLIYISPEGLQNKTLLAELKKRTVALFVVDEAHCISQWGHDFRFDYLELADIRMKLNHPPCLALTATATEEVIQDVIKHLNLQRPNVFRQSVDRPNLSIFVQHVETEEEKLQEILQIVQQRQDAGLIYCSSRQATEDLVAFLKQQDCFDVAFYHGGMDAFDRKMIQQQYINGELRLVCATNAFGMGINKPDIRYVIHYHFPSQLESYVQEMGRCSRDGKRGLSYVFALEEDVHIPYHFIDQEYLEEDQLNQLSRLIYQRGADLYTAETIDEISIQLRCSKQALKIALFHLERTLGPHGLDTQVTEEHIQSWKISIEEQKRKRLSKISTMYQWLYLGEDTCRRKYILDYFSEPELKAQTNQVEPNETSLYCCDRCGMPKSMVYEDVDKHDQAVKNRSDQHPDWKSKLEQLFPTETLEISKT